MTVHNSLSPNEGTGGGVHRYIPIIDKAQLLRFQLFQPTSKGGQIPYPLPNIQFVNPTYYLDSYAHYVQYSYCSEVFEYRNHINIHGYKNKKTEDKKKKLTGVYTSCTFKDISTGSQSNIKNYLPFFFLDIDPKQEIKKSLTSNFIPYVDSLRDSLKDCPYIKIIHKSVSEFGLVCVFQFPNNATIEEHKERVYSVIEYISDYLKDNKVFNKYFELDTATSNVNRTRILSYDSNLLYKPTSKLFTDIKHVEKRKYTKSKIEGLVSEKYDVGELISLNCDHLYIHGKYIKKKHNQDVCGSLNIDENTCYFYTGHNVDPFQESKLYNAKQICELFNIPFDVSEVSNTININKYLTETKETTNQVSNLLNTYKTCILNGNTGIGKTRFSKEYVKTRKEEVIIYALPRVLNVNEQEKEFKNFEAIHNENNNFDKVLTSNKILCCHASLPKILNDLLATGKSIYLMVDEFQEFNKNVSLGYLYERFLTDIKHKKASTCFISATISDAHLELYSTNVIEVIQKEKQKEKITLIFNDNKAKQKELCKRNYLLQFINENKKRGYVSGVFVEDKIRLNECAKLAESKGYKVLVLHANVDDKKQAIETITSDKLSEYDVFLHTSSLKSGVNITYDKVSMLALDTFYTKDNRKCLNITDTIQLMGRMRKGVKDFTIYIDFKIKEGKKLSYTNFYNSLHLDSIDISHIEKTQQIAFTGNDVYAELHQKKAFVSTQKVLKEYEHLTNVFTSLENFKNAFADAEIIEKQFSFDDSLKEEKKKVKLKTKVYKEMLLSCLYNDSNLVISAFVDAGIIDKKDFNYLPTKSNDQDIQFLVSHLYAKQSSTLKLLKNYQFLFKIYKNSDTVIDILSKNAEQIKLIIQRIKSNERQKQLRNLEASLSKYNLEQYTRKKNYADAIKKKLDQNRYSTLDKDSLIEISSKIPTKYKKAYRLKYFEILNILNIFYNVECNHNRVSKLSCINSKNELYFPIE